MTNSNRKCGEITFCTQLGKRVYVLNCIYCPHICLQWEMFIYHLEHEHDKSLNLEPIVQPEISKMPIKMEIPESITDEPTIAPPKKQKMLEEPLPSSAFDDPLESENSTSEMCLESCIKIEQEEECSPNLNLFETEENSSEMDVTCTKRRRAATVRYLDKIKKDPERYKEYCNKAAERMRKHREKLSEMAKSNIELLQERREKDRLRQKRLRERKKKNINTILQKEKREKDRIRQKTLRQKKKISAKAEEQIQPPNFCEKTLITPVFKKQKFQHNTVTTVIKEENVDERT